ncbi:MAG: OmpH family outer membrane protein [Bacteroidaceae bacterium]|nr:OmpH family outer membrane protein [Bacteroidaceae bacterium]
MKKLIIAALLLAPAALFAQKFGHFNSMEIIQAMPEFVTAQNELQTLGDQYQKELQAMQDEWNRKVENFTAQRDSLPPVVLERRQQEIQELGKRYQATAEKYQQELSNMEEEKMTEIRQKVLGAVKQIGDAGGYVYIMDSSTGIPYISATLSTDITAELKTKLGIK